MKLSRYFIISILVLFFLISAFTIAFFKAPGLHVRRAMYKIDENDPEEAIRICEWVLKYNPGYSLAYHRLGLAYTMKGELDKAIASFKKAVELEVNVIFYQQSLGIAYAQAGKYKGAMPQLKYCLTLDPEDPPTLYTLGTIYSDLGENDKAESFYKKAISISPDEPAYHFELGRLYYQMKEYNKAEEEYKKALSASPTDPYYQYHLAELYYSMGKYEQAYTAITVALSSKSDLNGARELHNQIIKKCPEKQIKAVGNIRK